MSENYFHSQRESFRESLNIKKWEMTGAYKEPTEFYEEKDGDFVLTEDKILIEFTHRTKHKYRLRVISVVDDKDMFEIVFDDDGESEIFSGNYTEVVDEALSWMRDKK